MSRDAAYLLQVCRQVLESPGDVACWVPGRIEFLGKHTDYAGGRSLVCAIERGIVFAANPRADGVIVVTDAIRRESCQFAAVPDLAIAAGWATYPMTTARRLARNFPGQLGGAHIVFASDLPSAAGLSSSSALVTGVFHVLTRLHGIQLLAEYRGTLDSPEREAEYASCIENGRDYGSLQGDTGVGTLGGSQDHAAIMLSSPGHLLQCAFHPLRQEASIPLPSDLVFAIGESGVVAEKTGSALAHFNRAAAAAARVTALARELAGGDGSVFQLLAGEPSLEFTIRRRLAQADDREFGAELLGRFEQMLMEAKVLVPDAADALRGNDLVALGHTVDISQLFAERMLGNQVPETIALANGARSLGAVAASAFGAGFGGSVWALVRQEDAAGFLASWRSGYEKECPARMSHGEFFVTRAGRPLTAL